MTKHIKILSIIGVFMIASCNDNILSEEPLNQISDKAVWNDPALMQANINNIYGGMGDGFYFVTMLSSVADEAMFTHNQGTFKVVKSNISPSDLGAFGNGRTAYLEWDNLYSRIRQANIFLKKTADFTGDSQEQVKRMRGEAHFLRAYFYHQLMRLFGGVPLITKVYGLKDKDTSVPRGSFKETVDFIVADADSAADNLPLSYSGDNVGRATKGAGLALKSRVLLYAASDLYNMNPSDMPETGYISGDQVQRWQAAQGAAKAVMDLGIYHLYKANPAPEDSTAKNYNNLFLGKSNDEVIMYHYFSRDVSNDPGASPGLGNNPNGYHGYAGNTPLQSLVDSYEMTDGSKFDWNDSEEASHPYENRDPRFYATILYDGAHWRKRYEDAQDMDPVGIIQTFSKLILPNGNTLPGIDTRNGPIEDWNGGYTHYYLRKFMDPTVDFRANKQLVPWPYFRYAEILLNYAEASIELGQEQQARSALNEIRRRAGMPEFDASITDKSLMDEYRNERRVEMAYEEQRYFDVRRWMIAPQVLGHNGRGIRINVKGKDRADRSSYYDYQYKVVDVQSRSWDDKMYFLPIRLEEMNRNDKLVQNPGY